MAPCRSILRGWVSRQRRLLAACLALLLILVALPAAAADSSSPPSSVEAAPVTAGSFRLAQVRILGVPVINVASPTVAGPEAGPDAAERARVIAGNLELLYRPQQPCTPGERV